MSVFQFTVEENTESTIITPIKPVDGDVGVSPVEPIRFKLEHETGPDLSTLSVSVNGVYYVIDGVVTGGATFEYTFDGDPITVDDVVVSSTIVTVTVRLSTPYPSPGLQTVTVTLENLDESGGGGGGDGEGEGEGGEGEGGGQGV